MRGPAAALATVLLVAGCGSEAEEETASEPTASSAESESEPAQEVATDSATESVGESATESAAQESATQTETETEAAAEEMVITIVDFSFDVPETIPAGSEVTVINEDGVGHTVTSDEEGIFDVPVGPGEEVTFTVPDEAGEYPFHCTPHPNMTSTLVIG